MHKVSAARTFQRSFEVRAGTVFSGRKRVRTSMQCSLPRRGKQVVLWKVACKRRLRERKRSDFDGGKTSRRVAREEDFMKKK